MLESRVQSSSSSDECPTDNNNNNTPSIRIKVIPASFGLDGFEEAIWEATESMLMNKLAHTTTTTATTSHTSKNDDDSNEYYCRQSITLVVAAPDLFTDPILLDGISSQAEFESDRFRIFSSHLSEKLAMMISGGASSLHDDIRITAYHPLWRMSERRRNGESNASSSTREQQFPYPCVAISV
jgi:hypothetical protein